MQFQTLMNEVTGPHCEVTISEDWAQGRSTFGGLVGAFVLQAMQKHIGGERLLLDFSASFVAPVFPDKMQIQVSTLREGGSVTQLTGQALQNGEVKFIMLATFGVARASAIAHTAARMPQVPERSKCQKLPFLPNVTPEFIKHFDMYIAWGGQPFSGTPSEVFGGWVRLAEPEPEITLPHVLGYIDAWPPATLPWPTAPCPASSLSWSVQFMHPMPAVSPKDYCAYQARLDFSRDGYGFTRAHLWNEQGELLAISQQTIAVFDQR